jgi:2-polyprenyl-3-methyl-5-hydroxy-6-metoxy-1,4-benzoquinol methylase
MARLTSNRKPKVPLENRLFALGQEAFLAGDFTGAAACFMKLLEADPRNPAAHFNLAGAQEKRGDLSAAQRELTLALRYRPSFAQAARRLSALLQRDGVCEAASLDGIGLLAALAFDSLDRQPLTDAAFAHLLETTPLGGAAAEAREGRERQAAPLALIHDRTAPCLSAPLMRIALTSGLNRHADLEPVLRGLRAAILNGLPAERFTDKDLTAFACALLQQCWLNEHVFAVRTVDAPEMPIPDRGRLLAGDAGEGIALLRRLLALPPGEAIGGSLGLRAGDCAAIRPKIVGQTLKQRLSEDEEIAALGSNIRRLSAPASGVSQRVARQYERSPYPRWSSLRLAGLETAKASLARFFEAGELEFMARSFRVLIAGAGTGQHAIAAASGYAPRGSVLAIDLSRASLAYGQRMAAKLGISNLDFAQADIAALGEEAGTFDIIEAVGVLHHMADPFAGWRALLKRLKPGGLMSIGLYSTIARQSIARLQQRADWPGRGCSDEDARAFRARLLASAQGGDADALAIRKSPDFHALSDFRDLLLHESEIWVSLPEIAAFLEAERLEFRGFVLPAHIEAAFRQQQAGAAWPGRLEEWDEFEAANPESFSGMYKFWCKVKR